MVFCNKEVMNDVQKYSRVTILILIDGFLQYKNKRRYNYQNTSHNPYFNRWFSAMIKQVTLDIFYRDGHNPYFNRWFSAINTCICRSAYVGNVTILILIDGFLQYIVAHDRKI